MDDYVITPRADYVALLDAIREKGGTSALMTTAEATAAVEAIETGGGYDFLDYSYPRGDIVTDATSLKVAAFLGRTGITSFVGGNVTTLGQISNNAQTFSGCTALTRVSMARLTSLYNNHRVFYGCSRLLSVSLPALSTLNSGFLFSGCSALTTIAFPNLQSNVAAYATFSDNCFSECTSLQSVDAGKVNSISTNVFKNDAALTVLVLRKTAAATTLSNINDFTGTPFASGGSGGTLYVPSTLISSYESATNWSTILGYTNNQILPIEGSIYETQYADGTPIT